MKKMLSIFGIALMAVPLAGITYSSIAISQNNSVENQDFVPETSSPYFVENPTTTIFVENPTFFENGSSSYNPMNYKGTSTPSFQTSINVDGYSTTTQFNIELKISNSYDYLDYYSDNWIENETLKSGFMIGLAFSDGNSANNEGNYNWFQEYGESIAVSMYVSDDGVLPINYNYLNNPEKYKTIYEFNQYSDSRSIDADFLINMPVSYFDPNDSHILVIDYKDNDVWKQVSFDINEFLSVDSTKEIMNNFDDNSQNYITYWLGEESEYKINSLSEITTDNGSTTYNYSFENTIYSNASIYGGDNYELSSGSFEFQIKYQLDSYQYTSSYGNDFGSNNPSTLVISTYEADAYNNALITAEPGYGKFKYDGAIGYSDDRYEPTVSTKFYTQDSSYEDGINEVELYPDDNNVFDLSMSISNSTPSVSLLMNQSSLTAQGYSSFESSNPTFLIWDVSNASPTDYRGSVSTTTAITILVISIALTSTAAILYITNRKVKKNEREISGSDSKIQFSIDSSEKI